MANSFSFICSSLSTECTRDFFLLLSPLSRAIPLRFQGVDGRIPLLPTDKACHAWPPSCRNSYSKRNQVCYCLQKSTLCWVRSIGRASTHSLSICLDRLCFSLIGGWAEKCPSPQDGLPYLSFWWHCTLELIMSETTGYLVMHLCQWHKNYTDMQSS